MASGSLVGNSSESEETFDLLCSACKEQKKNKEAEKYCVDCQDYYCSECLKLHSTLPALKGHKLLDKEAGQSGQLLMATERCERHNFKIVDMFCQNHDVIGCGTCIAVDHRECKDVYYIPEFVKAKANVIPEFLQRMKNIDSKFKEILKSFGDEVDALKTNKTKEIETIKTFAKKLKDKIEEAERDAISKVEERYEKLMAKINGDIDKIKRELVTFERKRGFIESTVENTPQAFVAMKLNESEIATTEAASDDIEQINLGRRVHFMLDSKFEKISKERIRLGNVNIMPYSFEYKGEIDIKLDSDANTCDVYGSCVLSDGSIVFADQCNKNLKLVDAVSLTVKDHYDLRTTPWDICCLDGKDIGVSLKNEKKVKVFKVDHKFCYKYELNFSFDCRNISYVDNTLYIYDSRRLQMCRLDGNILKTINIDSEINIINDIFISKSYKTIFVTNYDKGVICLNNSGHVRKTVTAEIELARGLAAAYDGKFFAGGWGSQNVILLNEKGEFEQTLIDKGIKGSPQALCISFNSGNLYVSNYNRDTAQIFGME